MADSQYPDRTPTFGGYGSDRASRRAFARFGRHVDGVLLKGGVALRAWYFSGSTFWAEGRVQYNMAFGEATLGLEAAVRAALEADPDCELLSIELSDAGPTPLVRRRRRKGKQKSSKYLYVKVREKGDGA